MAEHNSKLRIFDYGRHATRGGLGILLACLQLVAAACQFNATDKHSQLSPPPSAAATASESAVLKATEIPATTDNIHPRDGVICVPPGWQSRVVVRIAALHTVDGVPPIEVRECDDAAAEMSRGDAHLALLPGDGGLMIGSIQQALVVPFGSSIELLTLDQAQQVLDQGSSTIEILDWRDATPDQIVLRVDGVYPGESGYPLIQPWSLRAVQGFEEYAAAIAPILSPLLSDDQVVRLAAVGDVMLARRLGEIIASGWVEYPFEAVADILSSANLAVGNLESALGDQGEAEDKNFTFQAPVEAAQTLEYAGFDVLSLANNHALDYGERGLLQSIDLLREREIVTVGAGFDEIDAHKPYVTEINGLSIAFLAYVNVPVDWMGFDAQTWAASPTRPGVAWADPERIRLDVGEATQLADLIIVLLHSGNEFIYEPSSAQLAAAHVAVEAGAHLVLGHHTQVVQGLEFYQGGVIAYGLGNLANSDSGTDNSVILNVWLDSNGVRSLEIVPLKLLPDGHPTLASDAQAASIRHLFFTLCNDLR
jgi:poly-gamma-glutamate synthesis protein (capsule biosynthesis protein)